VRREVRFDDWIKAGEDLLDLRKDTRFRGIGALKKQAAKLLPAWRLMTPEVIAKTMHDFVAEVWKDILAAMPSSIELDEKADWMRRVGNWLCRRGATQTARR